MPTGLNALRHWCCGRAAQAVPHLAGCWHGPRGVDAASPAGGGPVCGFVDTPCAHVVADLLPRMGPDETRGSFRVQLHRLYLGPNPRPFIGVSIAMYGDAIQWFALKGQKGPLDRLEGKMFPEQLGLAAPSFVDVPLSTAPRTRLSSSPGTPASSSRTTGLPVCPTDSVTPYHMLRPQPG